MVTWYLWTRTYGWCKVVTFAGLIWVVKSGHPRTYCLRKGTVGKSHLPRNQYGKKCGHDSSTWMLLIVVRNLDLEADLCPPLCQFIRTTGSEFLIVHLSLILYLWHYWKSCWYRYFGYFWITTWMETMEMMFLSWMKVT